MGSHTLIPPLLSLAGLGRSSSSPHASAIAHAFTQLAQRLDPDAKPLGQTVVLQIVYEAVGDEPPLLGERYVVVVPVRYGA
jgi:hypothetical protein